MAEDEREGSARGSGAADDQDRRRGVPPDNQPAEEWGERQGTGQQIASGGKENPGPSTEPGQR